ncbi:MAG: hypothetical protein ABR529_15720 [Actinomycetota bacterium]
MLATRLANGNLMVPMPAYDDEHGDMGDGHIEVSPGHPLYADALERLERWEEYVRDLPPEQRR